jgi:hypothetical protein
MMELAKLTNIAFDRLNLNLYALRLTHSSQRI